MSVELIQDLIKKLADELNTATGSERGATPVPGQESEAMIGRSVAALQATARTMHAPDGQAPAGMLPREAAAAAGQPASWWPAPVSEARPGSSAPAAVAPPQLDP